MFESYPYSGAHDLAAMQSALARWIQAAGQCGYCHVGDVAHAIYNGLRGRVPPDQMVRLWRGGETLAVFVLVSRRGDYDAFVSPEHRGGEVEREALIWGYETARAVIQAKNEETTAPVVTGLDDCDGVRLRLLLDLGYTPYDDPAMLLNVRSLDGDLPEVKLPEGFHIRSVSVDDAEQLAAVHHGAFGSKWTAEEYREQVMVKPGYDPAREFVAVAPDGRFAAFCVLWRDDLNGIGLFEPVGTHQDFQRRGLGRALMARGLQAMRAWGLKTAHVINEADNEASGGLYRSAGFAPKHKIVWYSHP